MSACGGCADLGSHQRWCHRKVGTAAALFGRLGEQAESIGDQIGPNDFGLANRAYALAGDLLALAREQTTPPATRDLPETSED